jgi:hypothetical protein
MARSNRHIILKQILEITIPDSEDAFQLQREMGEISKGKLKTSLEKLFDKYSTPEEVVQIENLEIDIGRIRWLPSGDDFIEAIVKKIEEKLKSSNGHGDDKVKRIPIEQAIFEDWIYFLEKGYFPRNTKISSQDFYKREIPEILKSSPSFESRLRKSIINRPHGIERLVQQYPDGFLSVLFSALTGMPKKRIRDFKVEVQQAILSLNRLPGLKKNYSINTNHQSFWKWTFYQIISEKKKKPNEINLITDYFDYWIETQKPNDVKGESYMRQSLIEIIQDSPDSFPLLFGKKEEILNWVEGKTTTPPRPTLSGEADKINLPQKKEAHADHERNKASEPTSQENSLSISQQKNEQTNIKGPFKKPITFGKKEKGINRFQKNEATEGAQHLFKKGHDNEKELKEVDKKKDTHELKNSLISERLEKAPHETHEKNLEYTYPEESVWYVRYAGVVLVHSFLPFFFKNCGLTNDNEFINNVSQLRASQLIHYLATGEKVTPEHELLLPKFLCGIQFEQTVDREIRLSETEKTESVKLLQAAIDHWGKLKKTSPDGLREGFLLREGKLEKRSQGWYLTVEQKSMDILLNFLPWNLGMVKLPWMEELLRVEWG